MMRPFLTLVLVLSIIGGTWWYTKFVNSIVLQPEDYRAQLSTLRYSIEVLRTFEALPATELASKMENISFELQPTSLTVLFQGKVLLEDRSVLGAEQPVFIHEIPGMEIGENEIFVKAQLLPPSPHQLQALQIRVFQEDRQLSVATFSSHPGCTLIYGTVLIDTSDEIYH